MSAERFTWLHLTDLHVGLADADWLWPGVEEEVLFDLGRVHDTVGPIDAVFFTGDLTQCGDKGEFDRFNAIWRVIRAALARLGSTPVFVAVPGNHDLRRPADGSAALDGFRRWTADPALRRRFWTQDDGDYRRAVRQAFDPWTSWADSGIDWGRLENVQRYGLVPGDFAATLRKGSLAFGLLGLNTAALQLAGGDYRGRLSVHPRQASALVGKLYEWVADHDACFVLTHHDPSWFDADGLAFWNGEIAKPGRFLAHLCGHRHEQAHTIVVEGGAMPRRLVIGRSLFGLETYEHQGGRQERLHGYSIGMFEQGSSRRLRFWPRRDEPQQAGHRELRADQSVRLEQDQGTPVEELGPSRRSALPPPGPSISPRPAEPPSPLPGWVEITTEFLSSRREDPDHSALRLFSAPLQSEAARPQAPSQDTPGAASASPTPQSRTPMNTLSRDLIAVLAEEYPDVRDARAVWVRAGGSNGEVENIARPRDLWQALWLRSTRGASVRPAALLRAVLDDLPNNTVIIGELRIIAGARAVDAALARRGGHRG
jgi:hypothetical protein